MSASTAQSDLAASRAPYLDDVRTQGAADFQSKAFAAADIITAVIGLPTHTPLYQANQGAQMLKTAFDAKKKSGDVTVKPNPWFAANGHVDLVSGRYDAASPVTQTYLYNRAWKGLAGSGVSLGGSFLSVKTAGVNVGSAVRHGSSFLTTDAHMLGIWAIARSSRKSGTVAQWCEVIMRAKAAKATLRGTQFAGAVIPVPLAGALINVAAAAGKLGIKMGFPEICYLTAIEIHWRAFLEQKIAGGLGGGKKGMKVGPASRIFAEIFTRRGVTAVFGKYDVAALIGESAGWMALGDKLASS